MATKHRLMDEPPINFYPSLAVALGVNEAIIFQQLHFLLGVTEKAKNKYNLVEGRWWVYNSYKEWQANYFPWLHEGTIKRLFLVLEERGLVLSIQSVKNPSDRRKWYAIDYEAWEHLETTIGTNCSHGSSEQNVPVVGTNCSHGYSETTSEITETTTPAEKSNVDFSSGESPETETTEQRPLFANQDDSPFANQDDSPSKNGSQQGKAQGQGKRSRSTKPPHPNTQPIMDAYIEALGYTPANYPKEAATAKRMAEQGYTPEQVVATYKKIKEDKSGWWEEKFVSLGKVHEQIGEMYPPARQGANGEASPAKRYTFLNSSNIY
ncbi:MAG: hypothetical protein H0W34_02345 [Pyrinomonadaceae bacterium]|nr:hypothetical protein [Pyrinomonadaceae bacterium]